MFMKHLLIIVICWSLTMVKIEAQPLPWIKTCEQMPPDNQKIVIWYSRFPNTTPDNWAEAYYSSSLEAYFFSNSGEKGDYLLEERVSDWMIPTPPVSYCGGKEGDGGELE